MWTGGLVVLGLVLAALRLVYASTLSVSGEAFLTFARKLLATGDTERLERVCRAAPSPLTDAVRSTLEAAGRSGGADRDVLEGAFLDAFQRASTRLTSTRWVPGAVLGALAVGLGLSFVHGGLGPALVLVAVLAVVALVLTGQRLASMLSDATMVRDEVVSLLLEPREPYRLSRTDEREPAVVVPRDAMSDDAEPPLRQFVFFEFGDRDPTRFVASLVERLPSARAVRMHTSKGAWVAVSGDEELLREVRLVSENLRLGDDAPDSTVGPEARVYADLVAAADGPDETAGAVQRGGISRGA